MSLNVDNTAKAQPAPSELAQTDPSSAAAATRQPQAAAGTAATPGVQSLANSGTGGADSAAVGKFLSDHPEQKESLQNAAFAAGNYTLFHQLSQPAATPAAVQPQAANANPPANDKADQAPSESPGVREAGFALRHPFIASDVGSYQKGATNISTDAVRFSTLGPAGTPNSTLDGGSTEGSQVNAFRHTLWQATIGAKYGTDIAKEVGDVHEENPNVDLGQRSFKTLSQADQTIDLNNNVIGRQIAAQNPNASMKDLALKTLDAFHNDGLYTVTGQDAAGNVTIGRTKISDAQYNEMKSLINGVDNDGFTPAQRAQRDAESQPIPSGPI